MPTYCVVTARSGEEASKVHLLAAHGAPLAKDERRAHCTEEASSGSLLGGGMLSVSVVPCGVQTVPIQVRL